MELDFTELDFNWLDLPDKIWELILCDLKYRCLLNASETCKRFNELISMSKRMMTKFSFKIENSLSELFNKTINDGDKVYQTYFRELKVMRKCLQTSKRKYDSIKIRNHYDIFETYSNIDKKYIINVFFDILKQFAGSVEQITFSDTSIQNDEFTKIIQIMKNLKVLKFVEVCCYGDTVTEVVRPDIVAPMNEIFIQQVYRFSFQNLYLFDNLTTLDVNENQWNYLNYETFESFLMMQKNLKVLNLRNLYCLFQTDKLTSNIKFSLDELTLDAVYWTNQLYAMKFFKTQTNLKKLTLDLDHSWGIEYQELLIHLFGNNLQLKTVVFPTNSAYYKYIMTDFSFLEGIVNSSVENIQIDLVSLLNATAFITACNKLFPKVKFNYVNQSYSTFLKTRGLTIEEES